MGVGANFFTKKKSLSELVKIAKFQEIIKFRVVLKTQSLGAFNYYVCTYRGRGVQNAKYAIIGRGEVVSMGTFTHFFLNLVPATKATCNNY